jgi:hypothetical protein
MGERLWTPFLDLAKIQEATKGGRLTWVPSVLDALPTRVGRSPAELEQIIQTLTVAGNYFHSEVSDHAEYVGEPFDVYVWPIKRKKGVLFKFGEKPEGCFRVFSCHNTDTRMFLKAKNRGSQ